MLNHSIIICCIIHNEGYDLRENCQLGSTDNKCTSNTTSQTVLIKGFPNHICHIIAWELSNELMKVDQWLLYALWDFWGK